VTEDLTVHLALILAAGVLAQWVAWRFRLPAILLLLAAGLAAGPGFDIIDPNEIFGALLLPIVSLAVGVLLFEGGLTLRVRELPAIGSVVPRLVTIGALLSWAVAAAGARLMFDMSVGVAVLLGAILVVTGPTVIGPLLEHVRPAGDVRPILKWEGIVIDPIGAMLAVFVFESISAGSGSGLDLGAARGVALALAIGTALGLAAAAVVVLSLRRFWVPDALQVPVVLMVLLGSQVGADHVQSESGLLAATVMGITLANQNYVSVSRIAEFKESLRVLLIGGLFIVLAARLTRHDIQAVGFSGLAYLALLVIVARPLTVAVSTFRSSLEWRERVFLATMAPRGIVAAAVSSVVALRLADDGRRGADLLVPITFAVIIGTVIVYGIAAAPVARRLGLSQPDPQGILIAGAHRWARALARVFRDSGVRVQLVDNSWRNVTDARSDGLSCHHGNVLSEDTLDRLDLAGIGRLIAITPNDGINALAAQRFANVLGSANVFHLNAAGGKPGARDPIARELGGRTLFGPEFTFDEIEKGVAAGRVFKATPLTDQFTWNDYLARYRGAMLVATLDPSGRVALNTEASVSEVPAGRTVICLVEEPPPEARREDASR
jgi:NhaP-type Na+/H+ or K+/H+ antiporter